MGPEVAACLSSQGPHFSPAGLEKPETFGFKVGVSGFHCGDLEPRSQGEQGQAVGAGEVEKSLTPFPR